MGNIKIVGVSGKMGSGKNFFSEIFAQNSSVPVEMHAFADKVRDVTELVVGYKMKLTNEAGSPFYNAIYNYTQDDKNYVLPMWGKTIGECLQLVGTDLFRNNFDKNTWVKALLSTTGKECIENGHILVISDVRFPNEADAIIKEGGVVIRLEGDPLKARANSKRDLNHASETSLDDYKGFSKLIHNDVADLDLFKSKVKEFMIEFGFDLNS